MCGYVGDDAQVDELHRLARGVMPVHPLVLCGEAFGNGLPLVEAHRRPGKRHGHLIRLAHIAQVRSVAEGHTLSGIPFFHQHAMRAFFQQANGRIQLVQVDFIGLAHEGLHKMVLRAGLKQPNRREEPGSRWYQDPADP